MGLAERRKEAGISIAELARRSGVSAAELSDIEYGKRKPRATTVMALARALGCSYDDIEEDVGNEHL